MPESRAHEHQGGLGGVSGSFHFGTEPVRPVSLFTPVPPIITKEQIDNMAAILREGISRTMEDLRREVFGGG
jgi:hypothetical protein